MADLAIAHDVLVITDEVYEHLVFDGLSHVPISTLPGMAERTIKCGSAGKIFSLTGWKVGWLIASPEIATLMPKWSSLPVLDALT